MSLLSLDLVGKRIEVLKEIVPFKGTKPADLPIEMPSEIDMVVNRRTATALNLVLSSTLALRANRLID